MSIYFIRHAGLVKIGYSSNLQMRIGAIKAAIPSPDVTLIGHMPGDREVELHLHKVFSEHRFSGEWFFFAPDIVAFARMVLTPDLPTPTGRQVYRTTKSKQDRQILEDASQKMRAACAERWPSYNHADRRVAAAEFMGWSTRRARTVYEASKGCCLRQYEIEDLEALSSRADAQQIDPNTIGD